jgi:serine/threonine protein kinase
VAPEIFDKNGYSYKADIFSLGAVFYRLLTGKNLFIGSTAQERLKMNIACEISHVPGYLKGASP